MRNRGLGDRLGQQLDGAAQWSDRTPTLTISESPRDKPEESRSSLLDLIRQPWQYRHVEHVSLWTTSDSTSLPEFAVRFPVAATVFNGWSSSGCQSLAVRINHRSRLIPDPRVDTAQVQAGDSGVDQTDDVRISRGRVSLQSVAKTRELELLKRCHAISNIHDESSP